MWGVLHHTEQPLPEIRRSPPPRKLPMEPSQRRTPAGSTRRPRPAGTSSLVKPGVLHAETPPEATESKPTQLPDLRQEVTEEQRPDEVGAVVRSAWRASDEAKRLAAAGAAEARQCSDLVLRRVEGVSAEVAELRRTLQAATARVESEMDAAHRAVARCSAQQQSMPDASSMANFEAWTSALLRREIGDVEARLGAELARQRSLFEGEVRKRDQEANSMADRMRRNEEEAASRRLARPQQEQPPPRPVVFDTTELEARLESRLRADGARFMEDLAASDAKANDRDQNFWTALKEEREKRAALEATVGSTIEAAVRGLARATKKEFESMDERLEVAHQQFRQESNADRLRADDRLSRLENDSQRLSSTMPRLRSLVESSTAEVRAWCDDNRRSEAKNVEEKIEAIAKTLSSTREEFRSSCEKITADAAASRVADRAINAATCGLASEASARVLRREVAEATSECRSVCTDVAQRERRRAEIRADRLANDLEKRRSNDKTRGDVERCVETLVEFVAHDRRKDLDVEEARENEKRATLLREDATSARIVAYVAAVANHLEATLDAKLDRVCSALDVASERIDAHSTELWELNRRLAQLEGAAATECTTSRDDRDAIQALAVASRTQVVTAIRQVVHACSNDAKCAIEAHVVPLQEHLRRIQDTDLADLADRLKALEPDQIAWRNAANTAATVLASDRPSNLADLIDLHVVSVFPPAAPQDKPS